MKSRNASSLAPDEKSECCILHSRLKVGMLHPSLQIKSWNASSLAPNSKKGILHPSSVEHPLSEAFVSVDLGIKHPLSEALVSVDLGIKHLLFEALASVDLGIKHPLSEAFVSVDLGIKHPLSEAFLSVDLEISVGFKVYGWGLSPIEGSLCLLFSFSFCYFSSPLVLSCSTQS